MMAMTFSYQLSLDPELEAFRPEINYALGFVDDCYGLQRASIGPVLHYGKLPLGNAIHIPASLFPSGIGVDVDGIRLERARFASIETELLPRFTCSDSHRFPYDAIGLIFLMLSRIEERDCPISDRYDRFPASQAFTVRHNLHLDPPADRAAADIASALTGKTIPASRTQFSVRLTHDVDRLRPYHRRFEWLRPVLGDLIRRHDPRSAWKRCRSVIGSGEPWQSFRRLMDIEEGYGQKGHYYFMGPTRLSMDSPYAADMVPLLRRVMSEVRARGHVVGFHPGYATCTDAEEWFRQRNGLEAIAGCPVREGRQHVLRYQADSTPDIWEAGGMTYECSLAYPEVTGFRPGTCRQFHAYSLRYRKRLQLRQGASAICDFGLMGGKYQELSIEDSVAECDKAIAVCQRYGGELVVLFHTGLPELPWFEFYERLLSRIFR